MGNYRDNTPMANRDLGSVKTPIKTTRGGAVTVERRRSEYNYSIEETIKEDASNGPLSNGDVDQNANRKSPELFGNTLKTSDLSHKGKALYSSNNVSSAGPDEENILNPEPRLSSQMKQHATTL